MPAASNPFFQHIEGFSNRTAAARWQAYLLRTQFQELLTRARADDAASRHAQLADVPSEYHDFTLRRLPDGTEFVFSETIGGTQRAQTLSLRLNGISRWLFVDCFEGYESFLKDIYAELGVASPSSWTEKDERRLLCGNQSSNFSERRQALREDRAHSPLTILKRLKLVLPELERADETYDVRFSIKLASEMRHAIVHQESRVDPQELTDEIQEGLGRMLTDGERSRMMRYLAPVEVSGFASIQLVRSGSDFSIWDEALREISFQGALVYWSICKKFGYSI